jgi:hypothetical protein
VRARPRGHLCPVCIREAQQGVCRTHGPWRTHQLLTTADRRRTSREDWHPYEPAAQACPRCLGDVAEARGGFVCVDHGHDSDPHGPYRVDQLLGPTAQRESAVHRARLCRRLEVRRASRPSLALQMPDPARATRVLLSATVIAGTLAYLVR